MFIDKRGDITKDRRTVVLSQVVLGIRGFNRFKQSMKLNWNFQGGWGGPNQKAVRARCFDIFWNNTISTKKITFKYFTFFRDLDRERSKMEQQEKKVIADIKKMAKAGQMVCD